MKKILFIVFFIFLYSCGGGNNTTKTVKKENVFQIINFPEVLEKTRANIIYSSQFPGYVFDIESNENFTFFVNVDGIYIVNAENPEKVEVLKFFDTKKDALGLYVKDNFVYVADGTSKLTVVDVSDLNNIKVVENINLPKDAVDIFVTDRYIYAVDMDSFYIVKRNNPSKILSSIKTNGQSIGLHVYGRYAYIADSSNGLLIVDIKNPEKSIPVRIVKMPDDVLDVFVDDSYIYVAVYNEGIVILKNNPPNFEFLYQLDIDSYASGICACRRGYIYVADILGFKIITKSNKNSRLEDVLNEEEDVTKKSEIKSRLPTHIENNYKNTDSKLTRNFSSAEVGKLYDKAEENLVLNPSLKNKYIYTTDVDSFIVLDAKTHKLIHRYSTDGEINDFIVFKGFAYIIDSENSLKIIRLSDFKLVFSYTTEVEPIDIKLDSNRFELYIFERENVLEIIDISNPYNPFLIKKFTAQKTKDS